MSILAVWFAFTASAADGAVHYALCASCHGRAAEGIDWAEAPALAGLPADYVERQLLNYQTGLRGSHPDDAKGHQMQSMAKTLPSPSATRAVAEWIATLPAPEPPVTVQGDVTAGKALYAACATCHGEPGKAGVADAPPLTSLQDWYLVRQLQAYRQGIRGNDNADGPGTQMRTMVASLTNDQAVKDVVAFIQTLRDDPPGKPIP
ncbi:MAG: c-type cytochrome [Myxococcota bacterium]